MEKQSLTDSLNGMKIIISHDVLTLSKSENIVYVSILIKEFLFFITHIR